MSSAYDIAGFPEAVKSPLNGLILAGGYSTRMGTDKSLLTYHGVPQREYLFDLLSACCHEVFTSCREDQQVPSRLNPLYDSVEITGPMNGILSAFGHQISAWFVLAVDMPFVTKDALEFLLKERDPNRLATCFMNPELKRPEPLFTIWEKECFPFLTAFVKSGNISPRYFLETHSVKMVDPPDPKILKNVNFPGFTIEG